MDFENFKNQIKLHLYFYEFDDLAIIDAYNHLEKLDNGYRTNILGIKILFNEVNQIYDIDKKDFKIKSNEMYYGMDNIYLNQLIKDKNIIVTKGD